MSTTPPSEPSRLRAQAQRLSSWLLLGACVGVLCGCASALFLGLLELVTRTREAHRALVVGLPVAGLAVGLLLQRFGQSIQRGNNLVIDTLHDDGPVLPRRMAPMVLAGTLITHLFGGSAGREGTAVQMGASLADTLTARLGVRGPLRLELLFAGVAGGFGSVFGTPIAGAVFALEYVVVGRLQYRVLLPALTASLVGDLTTRAWGIGHTLYPSPAHLDLSVLLLCKWLLFAAFVALVTRSFVVLTHWLKQQGERYLVVLPRRMAVGGALVVIMWLLVDSDDYLGLGVPTIVRSFHDPALPPHAFALKVLFTAVTLAAGFVGGEVTPLFFVGATLGNALSSPLGLPLDLSAGVGLAAVFASAAKTPLALSIMAVELLGASLFPHVAIVCVVATLLAGRHGIYAAQRRLHDQER